MPVFSPESKTAPDGHNYIRSEHKCPMTSGIPGFHVIAHFLRAARATTTVVYSPPPQKPGLSSMLHLFISSTHPYQTSGSFHLLPPKDLVHQPPSRPLHHPRGFFVSEKIFGIFLSIFCFPFALFLGIFVHQRDTVASSSLPP